MGFRRFAGAVRLGLNDSIPITDRRFDLTWVVRGALGERWIIGLAPKAGPRVTSVLVQPEPGKSVALVTSAGAASQGEALVADHAAGETHQDRGEGCFAREIRHLPDGGGRVIAAARHGLRP